MPMFTLCHRSNGQIESVYNVICTPQEIKQLYLKLSRETPSTNTYQVTYSKQQPFHTKGFDAPDTDIYTPEQVEQMILNKLMAIHESYQEMFEGVAKKYQNPEGGLNAKGRAHFKKTEGANLKPPVSKTQAKKSPKAAGRRKSFCARMGGQKKMHNIDCSKTPDKDICKSLRKWDCNESLLRPVESILI